MTPQMQMYTGYLGVSLGVIAVVAHSLYRNGETFLAEIFGDRRLATSLNRLLAVGFCLVNVGMVALSAQVGADAANGQEVLQRLTVKLGATLLVLGVMHLVNLSVLNGYGRRRV